LRPSSYNTKVLCASTHQALYRRYITFLRIKFKLRFGSKRNCLVHFTRCLADMLACVGQLLVSFVVACGATLFVHRIPINSAEDAALAAPLVGKYASTIFSVGLLNGALLGVAIIPLSTAYATGEAFGWEAGLNRKIREACGSLHRVIVASALVILLPGIPLPRVMFLSQVLNGLLLPIILVFMIVLINDERIVGRYRNTLIFNSI
jgi:Mn2+/Fe2+ NRAMP family transporter